MTSPRLWKTWKVSDALLRRARLALPNPDAESKGEFTKLDKQFAEMLDHNEHELALDLIEEMGLIAQPRGGFWKDLERAAENMELEDRIPRIRSQFDKALARIKEGEQAIDFNTWPLASPTHHDNSTFNPQSKPRPEQVW